MILAGYVNNPVVDVIGVLTDQPDSRRAAKYWSVLRIRIKREGNELTTICSQPLQIVTV